MIYIVFFEKYFYFGRTSIWEGFGVIWRWEGGSLWRLCGFLCIAFGLFSGMCAAGEYWQAGYK